MITSLLKEVKQVLSWYKLEHEQQKRRRVEYTMQGHDVRVLR